MSKPRLLDGFCGAGGAGMGYHQAGFEVVGVDVEPQQNYPFEFYRADFFEFVSEHGGEFDAIHASPPCQAYVAGWIAINRTKGIVKNYPDLVGPTRVALLSIEKPYVIENVPGAPLASPVKLCGSSFGLGVRRHRLFESNVLLHGLACDHRRQGRAIGVYGSPGSAPLRSHEHGGGFGRAKNAEEAGTLMGINWMDWRELTQAIPPSYTFHIGTQLMWHLKGE